MQHEIDMHRDSRPLRRKGPGLGGLRLVPGCLLAAGMLATEAAAQGFAAWSYHRDIFMNTSSTGAGVAGNVNGFPVAVLLNAGNFNFNQAKGDGADLRFSKPDGSPLPHEIEQWDKSGQRAAVWVRTDVLGNSASQAISMHWGNASAPASGDGKAVFPTTDFIGVWHLSEEGNTAPGGYKDATPNQAHGTGINYAPGSAVEARIGRGALNSHANKTWILVDESKKDLFNPHPSWTLFIWTRITSFPSSGTYHTMMSKGDGSWSLQRIGSSKTFEPCCWQGSYHMCAVGKLQGATQTWYRFAASFTKGAGIKMYLNNVLDANAVDASQMAQNVNPMGIGNQTQGARSRWWDGVLDEVRVTQGARSADWIKLDYESQREGSAFLRHGEVSTSFQPRRMPGYLAPAARPLRVHDLQGRALPSHRRRPAGFHFIGPG